jgi:hypothetical protein
MRKVLTEDRVEELHTEARTAQADVLQKVFDTFTAKAEAAAAEASEAADEADEAAAPALDAADEASEADDDAEFAADVAEEAAFEASEADDAAEAAAAEASVAACAASETACAASAAAAFAVETAALALLFAVATSLDRVERSLVRLTTFACAMPVMPAPSPTSVPALNCPPISRLSAGPTLVSLPSWRTTILFTKSAMGIPFDAGAPAGSGGG